MNKRKLLILPFTIYHLPLTNKKAQSALELAVFGAILIFVVGVIVRQALSSAYSQNQSLRAMRLAMTTSYRYSWGMNGSDNKASHQSASILFIEDRLTAGSGRHAAVDRTPYVAGGSGTYSNQLFYPLESDETGNLPVIDVFINGKHFPFTTAAFRSVELARSCAGASSCPSECKGDCSDTSAQLYPANASVEWESDCVGITETISCVDDCNSAFCNPATDCVEGSTTTWTRTPYTVGCAKLYDIVYNHPGFTDWCDGEDGACPLGFSADERFDLDRDGATDVPGTARADFAWQWFLVMGWYEYSDSEDVTYTLLKGEGIKSPVIDENDEAQHTSIDVDQDLKRESIPSGSSNGWNIDSGTGVIKAFTVIDRQNGDMDMTRGDSDTGPDPGLQKNARMYSFVNGAYLLLEEGRLYAPDTGQYIRTAQKKDQVDIIERAIQLSNDTGRFCSGSTPNTDGSIWTTEVPNPVEACENCSSTENIQKTCMDRVRKVILVRSRVQDLRGRKWVTNTSGDDNVDFTVPGVP